ncbi:MAG: hypothetical protein ACD_63C00208G0003 [uncultured bacterium]|nr:MAG: hypothetical protein ACD_63C00208G0003 [uncultured bacterium]
MPVGNKQTKIVHNEGCVSIKKIKRSYRVKLPRKGKGRRGFRQCKKCR